MAIGDAYSWFFMGYGSGVIAKTSPIFSRVGTPAWEPSAADGADMTCNIKNISYNCKSIHYYQLTSIILPH
jgi:hypothetical protein